MTNTTVQPVDHLAKIRRTLVLARYYRQLDQADREISQYEKLAFGGTLIQPHKYDGLNGMIAKALRTSARNMLVQLEKQAGRGFMLGIGQQCAAWLSDVPFQKWPEYQHIFPAGSDLWSAPF